MHRFTAEFGMGSGGSNALLPPGKLAEAVRFYVTWVLTQIPLDSPVDPGNSLREFQGDD
jgi:hypothetical protein